MTPERMKEVGNLINTQDNRITDAPIFVVEEEIRIWGIRPDYGDKCAWVKPGEEYREADDNQIEIIESNVDFAESTGWEKIYYQITWRFVTACFTEQGCRDYLRINGHNIKNPRIYAYGSYRNREYRDVRQFLSQQG